MILIMISTLIKQPQNKLCFFSYFQSQSSCGGSSYQTIEVCPSCKIKLHI